MSLLARRFMRLFTFVASEYIDKIKSKRKKIIKIVILHFIFSSKMQKINIFRRFSATVFI